MLGSYDFCGHYEWTFSWLEREGGRGLLQAYWVGIVDPGTQELIQREGIAGMRRYWGHTLTEESPSLGFAITERPGVFRIDMRDCPSKGFLLRNGLENHRDYCDHCMGWIGPMMRACGWTIDHEHNHRGQCWWEMRRPDPARPVAAPGATSGDRDIRRNPAWAPPGAAIDRFIQANDSESKADPPSRNPIPP